MEIRNFVLFLIWCLVGEKMAAGEEKGRDFYAVLGLKKECTDSELRIAYKKLALRWHPDRCSASGNSKFVEEAKKKFQEIQEAYSVLSDVNKRFMYDVGVYDNDDDENGMGDFLNEMATMMSQTKSSGNGEESLEELQGLFNEIFQGDFTAFGSPTTPCSDSSSSSYASYNQSSNSNHKRNSCEMNYGKTTKAENSSAFNPHIQSFSLGTGGTRAKFEGGKKSKGRNLRNSHR